MPTISASTTLGIDLAALVPGPVTVLAGVVDRDGGCASRRRGAGSSSTIRG
jgi:hypothetical protein